MKHNLAIERHNKVEQKYKVTRGFKDPIFYIFNSLTGSHEDPGYDNFK
jgi:hypothetical protein